MSNFVKNTRCPRCASRGGDRSGNNLAIYDDEHEWCYACNYYKPGSIIEAYKAKSAAPRPTTSNWFTPSNIFNEQGMKWLKSFGLTNKEIDDNFFWDNKGYCVFNADKFQNARNFTGIGPKYMTRGNVRGNEVIFEHRGMVSELLLSCVIVEDAISAIKVSRVCSAVAIHNAVIPLELILKLSRTYKNLFIWLDKDKSKEMLSEATKARPYFSNVRVVFSDQDPKCYNDIEIKEKLC